MFPVHMCWLPDPAYYLQSITEEGQKLGRPVEKFATVIPCSVLSKSAKLVSRKSDSALC